MAKTWANLWDLLFGEKVKIQLSDGSFRTVSRKWIEKMEKQGLMKKIDHDLIRVHILDPYTELKNLLSQEVKEQGHYRQEFWVMGQDVSREQVADFKDPATGDLYVLMTTREGFSSPQRLVIKKAVWDDAKRKMDTI